MNPLLARPLRALFTVIDAIYRKWHGLVRVGPLFLIEPAMHEDDPRTLADGTVVKRGDAIGELHFDSAYIEKYRKKGQHPGEGAFEFRRLFVPAFKALAREVTENPRWKEMVAFHAISWFPPHGLKFGFEARPLPFNRKTRALARHYTLILYAYYPRGAKELAKTMHPHEFWISRKRLVDNFNHP